MDVVGMYVSEKQLQKNKANAANVLPRAAAAVAVAAAKPGCVRSARLASVPVEKSTSELGYEPPRHRADAVMWGA